MAKEVEILNKVYGGSTVVGVCITGPFTTILALRGLDGAVSDIQDNPLYFKALPEKSTREIIRYADILMDYGALALNENRKPTKHPKRYC